MKNTRLLIFSFAALCLFVAIFSNSRCFVYADLPAITLRPDGTIDPPTAAISHLGNTYVLTGNTKNYFLDIQCSDITLEGAGYTLIAQGTDSRTGILVEGDNVTVKDVSITGFGGLAIIVNGSSNVIENNFITRNGGGITIFGSNNYVADNNISSNMDSEISIYGSHNNITQNHLWGVYVDSQATNNMFVGNTLNVISIDGSDNIFYLNNFYISGDFGANFQENTFDYGGSGNYWSNYNGTDANHDGIGDTPYELIPNIKDSYPLMAPYDASSLTPPPHAQPTTSFTIELAAIAATATAIIIAAAIIMILLQKRKSKHEPPSETINQA